jgi:hypothetical protein
LLLLWGFAWVLRDVFLIAFFHKVGGKALDDVDFDEGCEVRNALLGDVEGRGDGARVGGGGVLLCDNVEGGRFVVSDAETHDHAFGTHGRRADEVLQRRLGVRIAEGVEIGAGIPVVGERSVAVGVQRFICMLLAKLILKTEHPKIPRRSSSLRPNRRNPTDKRQACTNTARASEAELTVGLSPGRDWLIS